MNQALDQQIKMIRASMIGDVDDPEPLSGISYEVPTINNENMLNVEDPTFYETKVGDEVFCDSKQFLFQDVYKYTIIISKRGIGKTYSAHEYVLDTAMEFVNFDLPTALNGNKRTDIQLPINVAYILQNALFHGSLIKTFNDMMSKYEVPDYVSLSVVSFQYERLGIQVNIDIGGKRPFTKIYYFAECFFLTQPNLARGRQFTNINFVIFDEFEKAFSQSLLDENKNRIDSDKLFDNFKDILNSFQRNKKLRYLFLGNITNLNSVIWDFLEIVDFNFIKQINEHESGDKMMILNLIPLFTNENMANYFEDLTTLGVSEEELFKMEGLVDEKNIIEELNPSSYVIFDGDYIYYFDKNICNIERVTMKSMEELNKIIQQEFITYETITSDDDELIAKWLADHNKDNNRWTQTLVPLDELRTEETIEKIKRINVYSTGKIVLDGTLAVNDTHEFFKGFKKDRYKFRTLREYFIYTNLIGK